MSRIFTFILGMLFCLVLLGGGVVIALPHLADWLVVDSEPVHADAIVVLGGGNGSRLRHAVQLYDRAFGEQLVLVGEVWPRWQDILRRSDSDLTAELRQHVVMAESASLSTVADLELALKYCRARDVRSLLVVTDPYHSRRAQVIVDHLFSDSGIATTVVHSGYYGTYRNPEQDWWQDEQTLQVVWVELGKIVYFVIGDW